jgi:hypothetical protein
MACVQLALSGNKSLSEQLRFPSSEHVSKPVRVEATALRIRTNMSHSA